MKTNKHIKSNRNEENLSKRQLSSAIIWRYENTDKLETAKNTETLKDALEAFDRDVSTVELTSRKRKKTDAYTSMCVCVYAYLCNIAPYQKSTYKTRYGLSNGSDDMYDWRDYRLYKIKKKKSSSHHTTITHHIQNIRRVLWMRLHDFEEPTSTTTIIILIIFCVYLFASCAFLTSHYENQIEVKLSKNAIGFEATKSKQFNWIQCTKWIKYKKIYVEKSTKQTSNEITRKTNDCVKIEGKKRTTCVQRVDGFWILIAVNFQRVLL